MKYVGSNQRINLSWTISRGASKVKEDFRRSSLFVFLTSNNEQIPLNYTLSENVITATLPTELPEGVYGLLAVWFKSASNPFEGGNDAGLPPLGRMSRSQVDDLFGITAVSNEADYSESSAVNIEVRSMVATYGYDGLSAYEIAVISGQTALRQSEWVSNITELNERLSEIESAETLRQTAETSRSSAEGKRVSSEIVRQQNENARQAAEKKRTSLRYYTEGDGSAEIHANSIRVYAEGSGKCLQLEGYKVVVKSGLDDIVLLPGPGYKAKVGAKEIATVDMLESIKNRLSALENNSMA
nr:MAG TPA: hypothetical protein [Caudoviricetes sp.]